MASEKTIVFITGGNTGLGLEVVKALCRTDTSYEIVIGCRTPSKGDAAIKAVKKEYPQTSSSMSTIQTDLASDSSIEKAVETLTSTYGRIDVLINNGGAAFDMEIQSGKMTIREAFNASWDTNVSGTHVLTTLAVPLLLKSKNPRLMFITSGTSTLTETERSDTPTLARLNTSPPAGWPKQTVGMNVTAYRSSKTGLNMVMYIHKPCLLFAGLGQEYVKTQNYVCSRTTFPFSRREWHRLLLNDGIKVWCISPGFLATGLGSVGPDKLKQMGALDPSEGGNFIKDVIQGKRDHDVGKVIRASMIQPW